MRGGDHGSPSHSRRSGGGGGKEGVRSGSNGCPMGVNGTKRDANGRLGDEDSAANDQNVMDLEGFQSYGAYERQNMDHGHVLHLQGMQNNEFSKSALDVSFPKDSLEVCMVESAGLPACKGAAEGELHGVECRNSAGCTQGVRQNVPLFKNFRSDQLEGTSGEMDEDTTPRRMESSQLQHDKVQHLPKDKLTSLPSHAQEIQHLQNFQQTNANAWKKKSWVALEKVMVDDFRCEDGVTITLDEEASRENMAKLERALVGRLLGRKLPFFFLQNDLRKKWSPWGDFKLIMVASDCFICIFNSVEARDAVLMNGPWFIAGKVLGLDRWSPSFSPKSLHGFSTPLWVRFPGLPLLYWDSKNLSRIASSIGEPLWMDAQTQEWGQSSYARICVKMDLSKQLPTGVWVKGIYGRFFQPLEYEGIHSLCFHCGLVGHKAENCPSKSKFQQTPTNFIRATREPQSPPMETLPSKNIVQGEVANPLKEATTNQEQQVHQHAGSQTKDNVVLSSHDPNEAQYGPWVLVTKKKNRPKAKGVQQHDLTTKGKPKVHAAKEKMPSSSADFKDKHAGSSSHTKSAARPPATPTLNAVFSNKYSIPPPQTSDIHASCSKSFTIDPVAHHMQAGPKSAVLNMQFSAIKDSLSEPMLSKQPTGYKHKPSKPRISKSLREKELKQLGPIEYVPKKRKKASNEATDGGDASPLGD